MNTLHIQHFLDGVKSIPDKNNGGCLFFCYIFWLCLKKHNIPTNSFEIVQYESPWEKEKENSPSQVNLQWIEDNSNTPKSSSHFSWLYDGIEYDAEGPLNNNRYKSYKKTTLCGLNTARVQLVKQFCHDALIKARWNTTFQ